MKKMILSFTLAFVFMLVPVVTVSAAQPWRDAYIEFLENKIEDRQLWTTGDFINLFDINQDGIPEMIIQRRISRGGGASVLRYRFYTFYNGEVVLAGQVLQEDNVNRFMVNTPADNGPGIIIEASILGSNFSRVHFQRFTIEGGSVATQYSATRISRTTGGLLHGETTRTHYINGIASTAEEYLEMINGVLAVDEDIRFHGLLARPSSPNIWDRIRDWQEIRTFNTALQ